MTKLRRELTALEFERLGLLALGWRHRDIAQFTNGTELSVRQAFHHTLTKTGASDKLELANRFAREVFMGYDDSNGPVPASFPKRVTVNGLCVFESRRGHHDIEATL